MKKKKKSLIGYLDRQSVKEWGDKLCNAYCMPAVCIEPFEDANIKVRITIEEISGSESEDGL